MTIAEKLAAEALPCRWAIPPAPRCGCWNCRLRPAVEAAIRKAINACADLVDVSNDLDDAFERIARLIEETP